MPADRPRRPNRPPDDDPGFEVVDDSPPVRPAAARPAPETGYEVVDDSPRRPKTRPKARVIDDDEDARPRRAGERVTDLGEGYNDLDPGERKLTKRDRRRVRQRMEEEEREERERNAQEWTFPSVVFAIGMVLTLAAAGVLASKGGFAAVGVAVTLVLTAVQCLLMVPLAIVALMVVGKLMGIEYGTPTHAVRSLAAVIAVDTGIYWATIAGVQYLPCAAWPVGAVLGFLATYGLIMQFFELDAMEARVTVGAINLVTGVGTFVATIAIIALVAILVSAARPRPGGGPAGPDDAGGLPAANGGPGAADPDDDDR